MRPDPPAVGTPANANGTATPGRIRYALRPVFHCRTRATRAPASGPHAWDPARLPRCAPPQPCIVQSPPNPIAQVMKSPLSMDPSDRYAFYCPPPTLSANQATPTPTPGDALP